VNHGFEIIIKYMFMHRVCSQPNKTIYTTKKWNVDKRFFKHAVSKLTT